MSVLVDPNTVNSLILTQGLNKFGRVFRRVYKQWGLYARGPYNRNLKKKPFRNELYLHVLIEIGFSFAVDIRSIVCFTRRLAYNLGGLLAAVYGIIS